MLQTLLAMILDKKRIIAWGSAVLLVLGGLLASMSTQEFKDAVCSAPVIQPPSLPVQQLAPAAPAPAAKPEPVKVEVK